MVVSMRVVKKKGEKPGRRFGPPQVWALIVQSVLTALVVGLGPAGELVAVWWGGVAASVTLLAVGYEAAFGTGEDEGYLIWLAGIGGIAAGFLMTALSVVLVVLQLLGGGGDPGAAAPEAAPVAEGEAPAAEGSEREETAKADGDKRTRRGVIRGTRSRLGKDAWDEEVKVAEDPGTREPDQMLVVWAMSTGAIGVIFIMGLIRRSFPWNFWTTFVVGLVATVPGILLGLPLKLIVGP